MMNFVCTSPVIKSVCTNEKVTQFYEIFLITPRCTTFLFENLCASFSHITTFNYLDFLGATTLIIKEIVSG